MREDDLRGVAVREDDGVVLGAHVARLLVKTFEITGKRDYQ